MHYKLDTELQNFVAQDSLPFFQYTHNTQGIITYVDDSMTKILGFSKKNFEKEYTNHLTANPLNKEVIKYTTRSMSGLQQEPYTVEIYDTDYNIHLLKVFGKPIIKDNKVIEIQGVAKLVS